MNIRTYSIKPIRSAQDEKAALEFLESVSDRETDKEILDKYEVVAELLEAYQSKNIFRKPLSPGRALKFFLADREISQKELEAKSGVDQATLSLLCAEKREFTLPQAKAISRALDLPASYFYPELQNLGEQTLPQTEDLADSVANKVLERLQGLLSTKKGTKRSSPENIKTSSTRKVSRAAIAKRKTQKASTRKRA